MNCITIISIAFFLLLFSVIKSFGGIAQKHLLRLYVETDSGYININTLSAQAHYDSAYKQLKEFDATLKTVKKYNGNKITSEQIASAEFLYQLAQTRFIAWKYVDRNGSQDIKDWKFEKLDTAITLAKTALNKYLSLGYFILEPEYYITIGVIHEYHNPNAAFENFSIALKVATRRNNVLQIAKAHEYIAGLNYFGISKYASISH